MTHSIEIMYLLGLIAAPLIFNSSKINCVNFWTLIKGLTTEMTLYYKILVKNSYIITCEIPAEKFKTPSHTLEDLTETLEKKIKDTGGELVKARITTHGGKNQDIIGYQEGDIIYGNVDTSKKVWTIPGYGKINSIGAYTKDVGGKPFEQNLSTITTTNLSNLESFNVQPANLSEEISYPLQKPVNKCLLTDLINYSTDFSHSLTHYEGDITKVEEFSIKKKYAEVVSDKASGKISKIIKEKSEIMEEIKKYATLNKHNEELLKEMSKFMRPGDELTSIKYDPVKDTIKFSFIESKNKAALAAQPSIDLLGLGEEF